MCHRIGGVWRWPGASTERPTGAVSKSKQIDHYK